MPTTLMKSSLILASILAFGCVPASRPAELRFVLSDGRRLDILTEKGSLIAAPGQGTQPVRVSGELQEKLVEADDKFALNEQTFFLGGAPTFAAVMRVPSSQDRPEGRCGAGHEDYILLIGVVEDHARLFDQMLIQSCLNDISLVSERGDDPRVAVLPSVYPEVARIQTSSSPDFQIMSKRIVVKERKLVMVEVSGKAE